MTKYLLLLALFLPLSLYATGSHHSGYPRHPVSPPVVPVPPPVDLPLVVPTVPPSLPSGGGQIYCSGPTSPGWNVSLPDGGCKPPVVVRLSDVPPTGLTLWQWVVQLLDFLKW